MERWDPIDQRSTDGARRLYHGTWATIIKIVVDLRAGPLGGGRGTVLLRFPAPCAVHTASAHPPCRLRLLMYVLMQELAVACPWPLPLSWRLGAVPLAMAQVGK